MSTVYKISRSSEDPSHWMVKATQDTAVVVRADKGGICHHCHTDVAVSSESDVYLLEGELHHPSCVIEKMAADEAGQRTDWA
jgi:hypothetical protein